MDNTQPRQEYRSHQTGNDGSVDRYPTGIYCPSHGPTFPERFRLSTFPEQIYADTITTLPGQLQKNKKSPAGYPHTRQEINKVFSGHPFTVWRLVLGDLAQNRRRKQAVGDPALLPHLFKIGGLLPVFIAYYLSFHTWRWTSFCSGMIKPRFQAFSFAGGQSGKVCITGGLFRLVHG